MAAANALGSEPERVSLIPEMMIMIRAARAIKEGMGLRRFRKTHSMPRIVATPLTTHSDVQVSMKILYQLRLVRFGDVDRTIEDVSNTEEVGDDLD